MESRADTSTLLNDYKSVTIILTQLKIYSKLSNMWKENCHICGKNVGILKHYLNILRKLLRYYTTSEFKK